jgi:poly(A) polymerase Pap1
MDEIQKKIHDWSNGQCFLIPFGSCRLCGDLPTSDIDLVCLTTVSRQILFQQLPLFLETQECKCIMVLQNTFVPVVKFKYKEKDFDLIFACLTIGNINAQTMSLLQLMNYVVSQEDLRSLQALYTTEYILKKVQGKQIEFSTLLRDVKLWCINQGIYSNPLGLLNGVTIAIMCTHIVCSYSNCSYLHKFFEVFSNWQWEKDPITIYHGNHTSIKKNFINVYTPFEIPLNTMHNLSKQQYEQIKRRFQNYGVVNNFFESDCCYITFQLVSRNHMKHYIHQSFIESKLKLLSTLFPENSFEYHTTCYEISTSRTLFYIKLLSLSKPEDHFIRYLHEQFILKISKIEEFSEFYVLTKLLDYSHLPSFVRN